MKVRQLLAGIVIGVLSVAGLAYADAGSTSARRDTSGLLESDAHVFEDEYVDFNGRIQHIDEICN